MTEVIERQVGAGQITRLGDFEVIGKIDEGGIAEIYLGKQSSLDRLVAIKILAPDYSANHEVVRRFEIESKIIARLRHPHIVHVIDRGIENGRYYFVMEMIEGTTFKKMLADKSVPQSRLFTVIIQVLKALDYAHKNGVVHRDIKPANILIDKGGNALVVDFGIAQIVDKDELDKTRPEAVMGTLNYMSPEQKLGSANVDQTTDIYAMGVILYELFTGQKPQGNFKNPSALNPEVKPAIDRIVMKCLEQNKNQRYQSAATLKDDLLSALHISAAKPAGQKELGGDLKDYVGRLSPLDVLRNAKVANAHLVEDRADGSLYVLKTILNSEAGIKEARILKGFRNPGFIRIIAAGGSKDKSIILMDYARGGSLEDRLLREYTPLAALQIFRQIAVCLDHAHKNNLIHGNLRPSNILFDEAGNVVLSDFGQHPNHKHDKNNWYTAPEKHKTCQSDIYSAGMILHRLLAGQLPIFDSYLRLIWQETYPKIPISLKMLLMQMLRNGPQDRPRSFEEVLARLDQSEKELLGKKAEYPAEESKGVPRWGARPLVLVVLIIIAVFALGLLIFGDSLFKPFFALTSK